MTHEQLTVNLALGSAAYFHVASAPTPTVYEKLLECLAARTGTPIDAVQMPAHLAALAQRAGGQARWDTLTAPGVVARPGGGGMRREDYNIPENAAKRRGYWVGRKGDFSVTLDLFNPNDELGLGYATARDPVVLLWFASERIPRDLRREDWLYAAIEEFDAILAPKSIVAAPSVAGVMQAYLEGRLPLSVPPWTLLYPLTAVDHATISTATALGTTFAVVRPLKGGRVLLQVDEGFRPEFRPDRSRAAARLVGRVAADEVLEGRYPSEFLPGAEAALAAFVWPTPVTNGMSAPVAALVASPSRATARQALYLVQAADALRQRGHVIGALQAPLVSDRIAITVPLVLSRAGRRDACAYTEAESWSPERQAAFERWLRDLRVESDAEVILVARTAAIDVSQMPGVTCIQHPYDELPAAT